MNVKKENIYFILLFTAGVLAVFFDITFLKKAFLKGDYLQQLFPWSTIYSASIKDLHLPLWIRSVQCGFPLFAEGQIGQLYPGNLLLFFTLPFRAAYNYSFLLHFIACGIFTFLFARKKGVDLWGGVLAAILICFGSAYAGCFVHLATLRTLSWFPLILLLLEEYLEKKKAGYLLFAALVGGMQLLAGSMQMALYAIFFYCFYFAYRSLEERRPILLFLRDIAVLAVAPFVIATPQIAATLQLSSHSNRLSLMTIDFALWNSFSPAAFIGSFMPYVGKIFSKGNVIYVSVTGLFFATVALWLSGRKKEMRPLVLMLVVSVFLALGKFNPLYVWVLKTLKFYSFRAPSRLIFFAIFSLSILAGEGFRYFQKKKEKIPGVIYGIFLSLLSVILAVFATAKFLLKYYGPEILQGAKTYVKNNIYGKPFHRYDLDTYMAGTEGFYENMKELFSFDNPYVLISVLTVLCAFLFIYALKKEDKYRNFLKFASLIFISLELFIFSFFSKGIRAEIAPFEYIVPKQQKVFSILEKDKGLFRICPFGRHEDMPVWLRPSMNAVYGLDSIAIYSPLVNQDYFLIMKGLGTVDDSIGIIPPEEKVLYEKLPLLKKLNVKYVVSTKELKHASLDSAVVDEGLYLYILKGYEGRFRLSGDAEGKKDVTAYIQIVEYSSGKAKIEVESTSGGFLIFSEKFYPGWKAYIDGNRAEIIETLDILQAVKLESGEHTIIFKYDLEYLNILLAAAVLVFIIILSIAVYSLVPREKQGKLS